MDAGRTHETPESETKDSISHGNSSSQNKQHFMAVRSPKPQFPAVDAKRSRWHLHTQWVALQERRPEPREPKSSITENKPACPLPQIERYPHPTGQRTSLPCAPRGDTLSSKALCSINIFMNRWSRAKWPSPLVTRPSETWETHGELLPTGGAYSLISRKCINLWMVSKYRLSLLCMILRYVNACI